MNEVVNKENCQSVAGSRFYMACGACVPPQKPTWTAPMPHTRNGIMAPSNPQALNFKQVNPVPFMIHCPIPVAQNARHADRRGPPIDETPGLPGLKLFVPKEIPNDSRDGMGVWQASGAYTANAFYHCAFKERNARGFPRRFPRGHVRLTSIYCFVIIRKKINDKNGIVGMFCVAR